MKALAIDSRSALALSKRELPAPFFAAPQGELKDIPAESLGYAYVEDVETLAPESLAGAFQDIWRLLRPLGLLRVTATDLDALAHAYLFEWRVGDSSGLSRAERMNAWRQDGSIRRLYNEEDLTLALSVAGFGDIRRFVLGAASDAVFWDRDNPELEFGFALEARKIAAK